MEYVVYTRALDSVEPRPGLRVVSSSWPTERRLTRILWEQSAWPALIARADFNLLHSMAFVTPILSSLPSVVTVYDLSFLHFPERFPTLQRNYLQSQTRRSVRQAQRVITISEASRQDLHRFYGAPLEKIDVVVPGIDAGYRTLAAEEVKAFREQHGVQRPFVLHVGTLQPRKNIPVLLRAVAGLGRDDLDLVLVGAKGWYYDEIFVEVERLGLSGRVHFPGYVRDEALPFWYNAAAALVFPSVYEGFGMPILEAMACGTPVIAAFSSSIPEAGGEAARYYEPDDDSALAEHLGEVLEDGELAARMSARGRQHASHFSWARAGMETATVYIRVLGG